MIVEEGMSGKSFRDLVKPMVIVKGGVDVRESCCRIVWPCIGGGEAMMAYVNGPIARPGSRLASTKESR